MDDFFAVRRDVNQSNDPRVGSARDNGTSTNVLGSTTGTNSSSGSALATTLIPALVYAAVCLIVFLFMRKRMPRVYSPRSLLPDLDPHERSPPLPTGYFNWIKPFFKLSDAYLLNHVSLDAYLFIRYMRVLCIICAVGCCITWPILLPLHVHGGGVNEQLDLLTFGNVTHPNWYYVHAFLAWIFFGFILYMVCRECVYYVNLRQAYLLSPYYANRLSAKTVMFTCVPQQYLNERRLRRVFGPTVKNVWIPRDDKELGFLVDERDKTALRLEKAEIELIRLANKERLKAEKHGNSDSDTRTELDLEANTEKLEPSPERTLSHSSSSSSKKAQSTRGSPDRERRVPALEPVRIEPSDANLGGKDSGMEVTDSDIAGLGSLTSTKVDSNEGKEADVELAETDPSSITSPTSTQFSGPNMDPHQKPQYGPEGPPWDINGSVAAQWISHSHRPSHRPLANYGRRVDTIKWTRNRLKLLIPKINRVRRAQRRGQGAPMPAVFVEFESQVDAQSAYQTLSHHRAMHMSQRYIDVRPFEVVWECLRMRWWERIVRMFAMSGGIVAMIIFWSIPCAFIGLVSNVNFLATNIPFLFWIVDLPSQILGVITGLLPAILLSVLMGIVPSLMRLCGRLAGVPTLSRLELFCQNAYFGFQVVQVFLVTTLTSAVSASFIQIFDNPASAETILSSSLPKSSNFYISYFIIQGLGMSANRLVQWCALIRFSTLFHTRNSPRFIARKWHTLRRVHWGGIFPVFTNLAVIAISYAFIAPIILGFALVGLLITSVIYRYNLLYVYDNEIDTRGLVYPRALKQTLTGVYLAQVCMIGLFGIRASIGPLVLMFGSVIFTALVHISLNEAIGPLLYNLPKTLAVEEQELLFPGSTEPNSKDSDTDSPNNDSGIFYPGIDDVDDSDDAGDEVTHEQLGTRGESIATHIPEGLPAATHLLTTSLSALVSKKISKQLHKAGMHPSRLSPYINHWFSPSPDPNVTKAGFVLRWLHPEVYSDYSVLRRTVPDDLPADPNIPKEKIRDAYFPPGMTRPMPRLWIPRDEGGVSKQEVDHCNRIKGVVCSDEGASVDEKGKIQLDLEMKSMVVEERFRW